MAYVEQDRFEDHIKESELKYRTIIDEIKEINNELDNRVTYKHFTWVLGILITILISLFGYISNQINDMRNGIYTMGKEVSIVNSSVSKIQGKLDPYNIEFK